MMTRTINFGWNEIKESYTVECGSCGKKYTRIISTGFNDMATAENRAEYRRKLKLDAVKYSKETITCNACIRKGISEPVPVEIVTAELAAAIAQIERESAALELRKETVEKQLRPHRNRLFVYEGHTYAQSSASFDAWQGRFTVHGYRISKTRPWETTEHQISAPIAQVVYLDDTLDARKAKAKRAA